MNDLLRRLPAVSAVLEDPAISALLEELPRSTVVAAVQEAMSYVRAELLAAAGDGSGAGAGSGSQPGPEPWDAPTAGELLHLVILRAGRLAMQAGGPSLRRVVNATGVVLHTNLGRALLSREAVAAACEAAGLPSNLEYDLVSGKRGSRHDHLTARLAALCGSEDAFAVNNNAGAVLLMLNTMAEGREVVVSRGELVEIGGAFRIPEIIGKSGARLVEVGTTNRTHREDYSRAIGPATAMILKVHPSNYRITGFVAEVGPAELAELGRARGLPVMYDLGSGAAPDFAAATGLEGEPSLREAIRAGVTVVTASGDKLLGGPQAGIIAGAAAPLQAARHNPLARALRLDKLSIAAMQATLDIYLRHSGDGVALARQIPVLEALARGPDQLEAEARHLAAGLEAELAGLAEVSVRPGFSEVGGGALPGRQLPTWLVAVRPLTLGAAALAERLRSAPVPVIGRIAGELWLADPRTLGDADADLVRAAMRLALGR